MLPWYKEGDVRSNPKKAMVDHILVVDDEPGILKLVSQLLTLAVSRRREYLADAMSAQFTRNPLALASALEKIEAAAAPTAAIKRGCAHLCIVDPLGHRLTNSEGWLADRFATHPPMSMRISRLKGMGYAQLKKEGGSFTSSALA